MDAHKRFCRPPTPACHVSWTGSTVYVKDTTFALLFRPLATQAKTGMLYPTRHQARYVSTVDEIRWALCVLGSE
ncbi:hypothetical protein GCM10017710_24170 [Arthrobacter ramosus]